MNFNKDFQMLNENLIYFDNAATSLKPKCVIEKMNEYYNKYSANSHRGDYNISFKVDDEIDKSRENVSLFINANRKEEIVFTSGTTDSINRIVFGFFEPILKRGDEVLLTKAEHASNVLPWFILAVKKGIVIKYIELDINNKVTKDNLLKSITDKTKVISLAHMSNVVGDIRDIKLISNIAHQNNIFILVDGAQSVPHIKTDVKELDIDFLVFSGHKMCGPMGIGVLYGKYEHLKRMRPFTFGGGMNDEYNEENLKLERIPFRFEAGTQNISGIIGLSESINYLNKIGISSIEKHNYYLKNYLLKRLNEISYITVLNPTSEGSIVLIKADNIFSSDLGLYLNSKNICVRSGNHCVKMLKNSDGIDDTVRISLYFYNSYEEIDYLIEVLKNKEELYTFSK